MRSDSLQILYFCSTIGMTIISNTIFVNLKNFPVFYILRSLQRKQNMKYNAARRSRKFSIDRLEPLMFPTIFESEQIMNLINAWIRCYDKYYNGVVFFSKMFCFTNVNRIRDNHKRKIYTIRLWQRIDVNNNTAWKKL